MTHTTFLLPLILLCFSNPLFAEEHPQGNGQDQGKTQEHGAAAPSAHSGPSAAAHSTAHAGPHWSYEGEGGPEHWGELDPKFQTCGQGGEQSPINLKWSKKKGEGPIEFHYAPSPLKIIDNGHTVQVSFAPGSKVIIRQKEYQLIQAHFHAQSEHTISNKSYPLEFHFVHKNEGGQLAVLGVMIEEGEENPSLDKVIRNLPKEKNKEVEVAAVTLNPLELLPTVQTYYHYMGSLTTPPCSERVNWNVFNTPVRASAAQISAFRTAYGHNNRPVQALNNRNPINF
ncbi:carbonic anhydrase family protein [Bdellovibrionota bacterium FG-2]